ncbi:hypothetical protein WJX81_008486 [Elliptochloris bilobata]|uniref:Uncharacterized protein n=1 Tax=Elliptochloris bilobata TaxID=381761 RepID=A0AAW1RWT5_9CHLO
MNGNTPSATEAPGTTNEYYIEEEEALGFHVWVAELELLIGTSRAPGQQPDPAECLEVLQKLQATLESDGGGGGVARVREYQRRCEDALVELLLRGAAPPVRRLASACLARLFAVGDVLPLFARVAAFQVFLGSREALARAVPAPVRAGVLQALTALVATHGRTLASGAPETLALALKHAARGSEAAVRAQALAAVAAVVAGLGDADRSAPAAQADALRGALRAARDSADAASRVAAAGVLQAVAEAGGAALWAAGGGGFEDAVRQCCSGLADPVHGAGDAWGAALGALAASGKSAAAAEAARALERKPSRRTALERLQSDAVSMCLMAPLVEAAMADRRSALRALAQAWLAYMAAEERRAADAEAALVDLAVRAIETLAVVSSAATAAAGGPAGSGAAGGCDAADADVGAAVSGGEMPAVQAAVLYVLRVGVIERLGESGQRRLLERLAALAASVLGGHVPVAVVALDAVGRLLEGLGEVPAEVVAGLEAPIVWKLLAPHSALRSQAAAVLAAMAAAEPSSTARLLGAQLGALSAAAGRLAAAAAPDAPSPAPGELAGVKPAMDAAHGFALGAAALLVAATRLPLGVPARLMREADSLARRLLLNPASKTGAAAGCEREAGYALLGALSAQLDLTRQAAAGAGPDPNPGRPDGEAVVAAEAWWRASALAALQAFMAGPGAAAGRVEAGRLQRSMAALLAPTLEAVCGAPSLQDPLRGRAGPGGAYAAAAAALQLRLLGAYAALPAAAAFTDQHEALLRLCARALRPAATASAAGAAASALLGVLNSQDAVLGPCAPGRDPLGDALAAFAGAPGGPTHLPWEAGLLYSSGGAGAKSYHSPSNAAASPEEPAFPQPHALGAALLAAQLGLLGSLLAAVSPANQARILDLMTAAAAGDSAAAAEGASSGSGGSSGARRKQLDAAARHTAVTCVAAAALGGLGDLARKCRGEGVGREDVAERARCLAETILAEAVEREDPALQRAAAEAFACAACIGSDAFAAGLVRGMARASAETPSPARRAALALAAGCIFRAKGGIALAAAVGGTASTLIALAASSPPAVHLWLLHGLWLAASAAGLAFLPHVRPALDLALGVLLAEGAAAVPGLRPAAGRLANAMVAVLGPELRLGSREYARCRALIREMAAGGLPGGDDAAAGLERVLYAQQLALFAPHAAPAVAHLPLLLATLRSRQPALRRAAVATLRHLAERDPEGVLPARLEGRLFAALDCEGDGRIASQLEATLQVSGGLGAAPRLRTRLFAARCVLDILAAVGADARHWDPAAAAADARGDWLVAQLPALVDAGFRMATGQVEALRPLGLRLLRALVRRFGAAPDPLAEGGGLLLVQHQAQFVAALRLALAPRAPPVAAAAGAALAAAFLGAGLAAGDALVLQRLMGLLCAPLAAWDAPAEEMFAEWVGARARLALLEAHAHCAVFAAGAAEPGACEAGGRRVEKSCNGVGNLGDLLDAPACLALAERLQQALNLVLQPALLDPAETLASADMPAMLAGVLADAAELLRMLASGSRGERMALRVGLGSELGPGPANGQPVDAAAALAESLAAGVLAVAAAAAPVVAGNDGAPLAAVRQGLGEAAMQQLHAALRAALAAAGDLVAAWPAQRLPLLCAGILLLEAAPSGAQATAAQAFLVAAVSAAAQRLHAAGAAAPAPATAGGAKRELSWRRASDASRCWRPLAHRAPQAAATARRLLIGKGPGTGWGAMHEDDVQVAGEALKLFLAALPAAARAGGEPGEAAVAAVLAPLLVAAAAPPGGQRPQPALAELALRAVAALAAGGSAAAFRAALAALPADAKQRLQACSPFLFAPFPRGALKASAATAAPAPAASTQRLPAIALRNFAAM